MAKLTNWIELAEFRAAATAWSLVGSGETRFCPFDSVGTATVGTQELFQ
jgi:hypothetical protein